MRSNSECSTEKGKENRLKTKLLRAFEKQQERETARERW
jgi:hypothetical protein